MKRAGLTADLKAYVFDLGTPILVKLWEDDVYRGRMTSAGGRDDGVSKRSRLAAR